MKLSKFRIVFVYLIVVSSIIGSIYVLINSSSPDVNLINQKESTVVWRDVDSSNVDAVSFVDNAEQSSDTECSLGSKKLFSQRFIDDPTEPLSAIKELSRSRDRKSCYEVALLTWYDLDIAAVTQWVADQPYNSELDSVLPRLVKLSSSDPAIAVHYAEKILSRSLRNNYLSTLIEQWVVLDPAETIYWSLEERQDDDKWLKLSFDTLSKDSTPEAISSLKFLNYANSEQLNTSIKSVIKYFDKDKVDRKTLLVIDELVPYEVKETLITALLPLLVSSENISLEDMNVLLYSLVPGETKTSIQHEIVYNWMSKNPVEAAQYAQSLEEGQGRTRALNTVVSTWIQTDIEATSAWVRTLNGNIDTLANMLGNELAARGDIKKAHTWFNEIEYESKRTKALHDLVTDWYEQDRTASVYNLVMQENLSAQQKLDLLHQLYPDEEFSDPNEALDNLERLVAE